MNLKVLNADDIFKRIRETPHSDKETVQIYHNFLKEIIDSGKYVRIPSMKHRMMHEIMWMVGHEIFENYEDFNKASINFIKGDSFHNTQANRFDFWYAKTYLTDKMCEFCEEKEWAIAVRNRAEKESLNFYGKSLDEINIDL
ncbi:MAG TPA: hypothetical protein P5277_04180 [Candidatus Paceibacterota bacterium]|nr:hypothetical protein [Candidatus Paceibacterota bacterium]